MINSVVGFFYDAVRGTISSVVTAASDNFSLSKSLLMSISSDYYSGWMDSLTVGLVAYFLYKAAKVSWKVTAAVCVVAIAMRVFDMDSLEVLENTFAEIRARSAKGNGLKGIDASRQPAT